MRSWFPRKSFDLSHRIRRNPAIIKSEIKKNDKEKEAILKSDIDMITDGLMPLWTSREAATLSRDICVSALDKK